MKDNRSALLVRCTSEEADLIREAAKREHRTLSGYILNATMGRIQHREELVERLPEEVRLRLSRFLDS